MVNSPQSLLVGKRRKPLGKVALRAVLGADDLECVGSKACARKGKPRIYMGSGPRVCQQLLCLRVLRGDNRHQLEGQEPPRAGKVAEKTPGAFGLSPVVKSVCELQRDR